MSTTDTTYPSTTAPEAGATPAHDAGGGPPPSIDPATVERFVGQVVTDAGAAASVLLTHLGDRLGLYRAMADGRAVTPEELASRTGTAPRLVQEWLANQAVGGYVEHEPGTGRFRLPPENAFVLAVEDGPANLQGLIDMVAALYLGVDTQLTAFRTGTGLTWAEQPEAVFAATERSFRPSYLAHLVDAWIPALDGLAGRLEHGARVADVGSGRGTTTLIMAEAYPRSTFVGYDYHAPSVEVAREAARRAGLQDRASFEVARATDVRGPVDLVVMCDAWHDTADPLGVARAARAALVPDGRVLLVEPRAGDSLEENMNPLSRLVYAISTVACTPCSVSEGGPGLGAQAGEARTSEIFREAGFTTFRRVAETPLNLVYEAAP